MARHSGHKNRANMAVSIDNPNSWVRYRRKMCDSCVASCCSLPVEAKRADLLQMGVIDPFEAEDAADQIAKKLLKAGTIEHFNRKNETFTLKRRANGDCALLDPRTRRCTIYANRPQICRNHPKVGPRPGYCAYVEKK